MSRNELTLRGLAAARIRAGLTQTELALRLGLTRQSVYLWEAGLRNPGSAMLPRIARALGCEIEELFNLRLDPGEEEGFVPGGFAADRADCRGLRPRNDIIAKEDEYDHEQ